MRPIPFHPGNEAAYREWRARKLADYPARVEDLIVRIKDPRRLDDVEHAALLARLRKANMAIYASECGSDPDKDIPRLLGRQFGLTRLDANWLADGDSISSLAVAEGAPKGEFIPYTDRPIKWHTDGYYNPPERRIRGLILHCVQSAPEGGENRLLDPEIAYLLLRDRNPDYIRGLMAPDVMTIPARSDDNGVARAAETGPVFSILPGGDLHLRYTARRISIEWKQDPMTRAAVRLLEELLESPLPYVFQARLEPGMGLLCNNVLHDRSGFRDGETRRRLVYRARYYDRGEGTSWREAQAASPEVAL
ncbi:MAG: TauD/TfdA family dioxygenase [Betaproteobacteria bacterium]|nr:TauD/TfdA family dioxygenase [Betaproteobacteria bacterium]